MKTKTLEELRAFSEGYLQGLWACNASVQGIDDWVVWDEYDINFAGADYTGHAKNDNDLHVDAYKAGWTDSIGEPLYSFTIFTSNGEIA
jgi:hypothetical protein